MGYSETGATAADCRSYESLKVAAGSHSSKLAIGMSSNAAQWQDASVMEHLRWVIDDGSVGLAIWDAQLREPAWRTKETWLAITKIRRPAKQSDAVAPATAEDPKAVKSKAEDDEKLEPQSKVRSQ
jgi:hypothetical protein